MFKKIICCGIMIALGFTSIVSPSFAAKAIILTDAELDQVYAEGLFFDFDVSFGSINDIVQNGIANNQPTSSDNTSVANNPNIQYIKSGKSAPSNTSQGQNSTSNSNSGGIAPILGGLTNPQTILGNNLPSGGNTSTSSTNTSDFASTQNLIQNMGLGNNTASGTNPGQTSTNNTPPAPAIDLNNVASTLLNPATNSNLPAGGTNTPAPAVTNPVVASNPAPVNSTPASPVPTNTVAATPTTNTTSTSPAPTNTVAAVPTTSTTPTSTAPTATPSSTPTATLASTNNTGNLTDTLTPESITQNSPLEFNIVAGQNGQLEVALIPNSSILPEGIVDIPGISVPLDGSDPEPPEVPVPSIPQISDIANLLATGSAGNFVIVDDLAQQNLSALVNVNAAGSVVPVVLNITININSTIETLNNINNLDLANYLSFQ